jgi:hypothetical protein
MNHEDAIDFAPEKHTAHWYLKKGPRKNFFLTSPKLLKDREFIKFVVIRNPAKRLVSGYLDKFAKKSRKETDVVKFRKQISRKFGRNITADTLTFEDFCRYQFVIAD